MSARCTCATTAPWRRSAALANVRRTPDLAVLHIADTIDARVGGSVGRPVLVARALPRASTYEAGSIDARRDGWGR